MRQPVDSVLACGFSVYSLDYSHYLCIFWLSLTESEANPNNNAGWSLRNVGGRAYSRSEDVKPVA